jgi:hypothetical protein
VECGRNVLINSSLTKWDSAATRQERNSQHIWFVHELDMFFVCDLFGDAQFPETASPSAPIFYSRLVRSEFESNYRRFHVRADQHSARGLPGSGGIAASDDYRAARTPGTAAAVWEAVAGDGLRPVCLPEWE